MHSAHRKNRDSISASAAGHFYTPPEKGDPAKSPPALNIPPPRVTFSIVVRERLGGIRARRQPIRPIRRLLFCSRLLAPPFLAELLRPRAIALSVAVFGAAQLVGSCFGIGLPCVFHRVTGLPCPGCGLTRSILALLRGHVAQSFALHPFGPPLLLALVFAALVTLLPDRSLRLAAQIPRPPRSQNRLHPDCLCPADAALDRPAHRRPAAGPR